MKSVLRILNFFVFFDMRGSIFQSSNKKKTHKVLNKDISHTFGCDYHPQSIQLSCKPNRRLFGHISTENKTIK